MLVEVLLYNICLINVFGIVNVELNLTVIFIVFYSGARHHRVSYTFDFYRSTDLSHVFLVVVLFVS